MMMKKKWVKGRERERREEDNNGKKIGRRAK